ncbi:hypothetical protein G7046_g2298 [Stylonectria norvegica]|nr:hypothetical protein G7046_g2298 [Stylonectria norvegica]
MYDDDQDSFSLVSTAGGETRYTPSEQSLDEFEFLSDDNGTEERHEDISSRESTSVTDSVYAHEFAHGRRYHSYKSGRYPLPNDTKEQNREELIHAMMLEITGQKLFFSDIGESPEKIIDIGTGTGHWAIDVADLFPAALVVGTDLSPIQPTWTPVNVRMFVEDCEEPEWTHGSGFDLVHLRGVASVIRDLAALVVKAYSHIKNGGWIEIQELHHEVFCDDGSMVEHDSVLIFNKTLAEGMERIGCTEFGNQNLVKALERAGFKNVRLVIHKVPIGSWPKHAQMKKLGVFMKATIAESLGGTVAKPFEAAGITTGQRKELEIAVRKGLDDNKVHRYVKCYSCYGQKDERTSDSDSMSFL